jgi:hypothetical protein
MVIGIPFITTSKMIFYVGISALEKKVLFISELPMYFIKLITKSCDSL